MDIRKNDNIIWATASIVMENRLKQASHQGIQINSDCGSKLIFCVLLPSAFMITY